MSENVAKYDFKLNPGYAAISIRKGPKAYSSDVWVDRDKHLTHRELRGKDFEKLVLRSMGVINKYSRDPVLLESRGLPLPVKVRTEDEETEEFARKFIEEHGIGRIFQPDVARRMHITAVFGPEHEVDAERLGGVD